MPDRFAESVTLTVKFEVPDAVGVPLMAPLALRVKPAGSAPALTDHVYGGVPPLAPRFCGPYFVPAVPAGSEVVVTLGGAGAGLMTIWRGCVPDRFAESVALTVKLNVPDAVGVPVIAPLLARVKPAGSAPALTDHEYGGVPPVALRFCCGYAVPAVPDGSDVVVTVGGVGAGLMTICRGCVPDRFAESVALTVKLYVPAVVGVPVSAPVLASVKPGGNAPTLTDHVYGGVPPPAVRFCCG